MKTPIPDAVYVVTHPERTARFPALLASSWATLMESRGKTVNFERMGAPGTDRAAQPLGPVDQPSLPCQRIRARVRQHVHAARIPGPAPLILRDAVPAQTSPQSAPASLTEPGPVTV